MQVNLLPSRRAQADRQGHPAPEDPGHRTREGSTWLLPSPVVQSDSRDVNK